MCRKFGWLFTPYMRHSGWMDNLLKGQVSNFANLSRLGCARNFNIFAICRKNTHLSGHPDFRDRFGNVSKKKLRFLSPLPTKKKHSYTSFPGTSPLLVKCKPSLDGLLRTPWSISRGLKKIEKNRISKRRTCISSVYTSIGTKKVLSIFGL